MKTVEIAEQERLQVKQENIIQMPLGLLGFEQIKKYVLLATPEEAPFMWLQMLDNANQGFVVTPGDTIGKRQPNIPSWRVNMVGTYRWAPQWSTSVGARYSSPQYRTLDNSDVNGFTYMGVSKFFVVDLRAQWKATKHLTASAGIDNVNNYKYWNFHPYPQRSYVAELKVDL